MLLLVQFPALGVADGGVASAFAELSLVVDGVAVATKVAQLQVDLHEAFASILLQVLSNMA